MGISGEVALAAAKKYTAESLIGGGALKGKNCVIKSISPITGGNRVTFEWTLDDGTVETDTMDVMDGAGGDSELIDALEDNVTVQDNTNLFSIPDGEYSGYGLSVKIKDSVITLNTPDGALAANLYVKLTNGVKISGSAKSEWRQESVSFLQVGKTYGYRNFILGGTQIKHGTTGSCRDSSGTSVLSHAHPLVTLDAGVSFITLYVPTGQVMKDLQYKIVISENKIPTDVTDITAYKDYWKEYTSELALNTEHYIDVDLTPMGLSVAYTQGMCTDGTNLYVATINHQDDTQNTLVSKYLLSDGSLVDDECSYSLGHANSMTYCDYTDKIYVVALNNTGTIHMINRDLTYVDSFDIDLTDVYSAYTGIGAISYNSVRQKFVCLLRGNRKGYALFDKDFNFEGIVWTTKISSPDSTLGEAVYGTMTTDENFIYQVIGKRPSMVAVFTYGGKYVGQIILPTSTDKMELEEIAITGGYAYLNVNKEAGHTAPYVQKLLCEYTRWADTL